MAHEDFDAPGKYGSTVLQQDIDFNRCPKTVNGIQNSDLRLGSNRWPQEMSGFLDFCSLTFDQLKPVSRCVKAVFAFPGFSRFISAQHSEFHVFIPEFANGTYKE